MFPDISAILVDRQIWPIYLTDNEQNNNRFSQGWCHKDVALARQWIFLVGPYTDPQNHSVWVGHVAQGTHRASEKPSVRGRPLVMCLPSSIRFRHGMRVARHGLLL